MSQKDALNLTLKPNQVKLAMQYADTIKDSLMIWGAPGIGKSSIARQYADEMYPLRKNSEARLNLFDLQIEAAETEDEKKQLRTAKAVYESKLLDQDTNFVDFRLSQVEPTDLRGIPVPEKVYRDMDGKTIIESDLAEVKQYIAETAVVWAAPKVLKLEDGWKGVIMFDEINSAIPIVQAASYQLILDRCVGEMVLPKGAFVLAAGNREGDGGVTFTLATPLRDRMTHIEMTADHQSWIDTYAIANRVHPATVAFINNSGSKYFNTLKPNDPSHSGGSSPRSWEVVGKYQGEYNSGKMDKGVFQCMVAGRVSDAIALEYVEFVDNVANLPNTMDILKGDIKEIDKKLDISANYFITLNLVYKISDMYNDKMAQKLKNEDWAIYVNNFIKFLDLNFSKTSAELSVLAIRSITQAGVRITYKDAPAFMEFVKKYSALIQKARDF